MKKFERWAYEYYELVDYIAFNTAKILVVVWLLIALAEIYPRVVSWMIDIGAPSFEVVIISVSTIFVICYWMAQFASWVPDKYQLKKEVRA